MDGTQADSSLVSIRVLSVTPLRAGKLFALASVEIDIDGIQIAIHGIRALNAPGGTRVELPQIPRSERRVATSNHPARRSPRPDRRRGLGRALGRSLQRGSRHRAARIVLRPGDRVARGAHAGVVEQIEGEMVGVLEAATGRSQYPTRSASTPQSTGLKRDLAEVVA
jgi:hypothetical protein